MRLHRSDREQARSYILFNRGKPLLLGMLVLTFFATSAHAEIIAIQAPHLGEGKTLRAQFFVPESKAGPQADASVDVKTSPKTEPVKADSKTESKSDSTAEAKNAKSKSETPVARRPAAILLHGCGGIGAKGNVNARHAMWKDWLVERGFVVVFPESFSSRGYEEICTQKFSTRTIKQSDRADDVIATKKWLLSRTDVDPEKLVLWGWSHGGGAVLATITRQERVTIDPQTNKPRIAADTDAKFAQAISFYPGCSSYAMTSRIITLSSPLTLLIGGADDWTPAEPCKIFVETMRSQKQPATITLFPDAYHDFDNPTGKIRVRKDVPNGVHGAEKGVTVGPNPDAREAAKKQLDQLLRDAKLITTTPVKLNR